MIRRIRYLLRSLLRGLFSENQFLMNETIRWLTHSGIREQGHYLIITGNINRNGKPANGHIVMYVQKLDEWMVFPVRGPRKMP